MRSQRNGGRASMGPPFENGGGELATERDPKRLSERSMGPPLENGGGSTH